jgi:hypothetical protein
MARTLRFVLLCMLLANSSIGRADSQNAITTSADESRLHDFFHEPFEMPLAYSMVLADARDRVLGRFGSPDAQESTRYAARTSDELLWYTVLNYGGMTITLGESEDRTRSWLESIEVTDNEYRLRFGLHIGASHSDIVNCFRDIHYVERNHELQYDAEIWESRTDTKYRPGEAVTVTSAMELTLTFDDNGRVSRILIESIEL